MHKTFFIQEIRKVQFEICLLAVLCLLKWTFEHFGHWPFWRFAIFGYVKKDHLLHILGLDLCIHKLKVQSK